MRAIIAAALCVCIAAITVSCDRAGAPPGGGDVSGGAAAPTPTNRVDIPPVVRQNLGLTFATVERRAVTRTLRVPGRFELIPTARQEYRAIAPGTVELLVRQYQEVEAGTPLYRLESARWREVQRELADAEASVRLAEAADENIAPLLAAHETHHNEIQKAIDLWQARVASLERLAEAGGARGDDLAQARASLAAARSDLAETLETEADLLARRAQGAASLEAARARLAFLFESAATLAGVSVSELQAASAGDPGAARWRTLAGIEVRALTPGVVESVGVVSGGVIDELGTVLTTVQPDRVRFRAVGLQSDLPRLTGGQRASVVAAAAYPGPDGERLAALAGVLTLAPTADHERRTIDLILEPAGGGAPPAWARAGVAAFLEVVTGGTGDDELAIPLRCVARDGTRAIIFRRDPADPDKAIRMDADLGPDDGRWVVIKSGVAEGNEVVLEGVYQLMVATSGTITKGGHFHPDGTFHEGDH